MPTIEDILSDISVEIAQLAGDVTAIGSASTSNAGLVKVANQTTPEDTAVPTVAFLKNRNILGASGEAGGGLPQGQLDKVAALPAPAILAALASLPANISSLAGRIIAVNAAGNGYEIIVAPSGGGGGGSPLTIAVDHFTGNGTATQFTLSQAPGNSNALDLTVSGITIDPAIYSVSGTTLTFNDAPPVTNTNEIVARHLAATATIGVPDDNTVSTIKLINKAITLQKIADGTPGKYLKFNTTTGIIEAADALPIDNSLTTAKYINKSITIAKIADGTPGRILKFNSSTGVLEEADVAVLGGGYTLIDTQVATNAAQVDFTSGITSAFKEYVIRGTDITAATSGGVGLRVRVAGVFRTGGEYTYGGGGTSNQQGNLSITNANGNEYIIIPSTVMPNDENGNVSFDLSITNPTGTSRTKAIRSNAGGSNSGYNGGFACQSGGRWFGVSTSAPLNYSALDGFRLLSTSGTITGTFKLYGLA